jgi:hypothetical protein
MYYWVVMQTEGTSRRYINFKPLVDLKSKVKKLIASWADDLGYIYYNIS